MQKWLENALDLGITELEFWSMTIAEINRAMASRVRINKNNIKERACLDYVLAQLITKGVGIAFGAKDSFPSFNEVYNPLLETEEHNNNKNKLQEAKDELSSLRLKMFAQSFNKRYEEVLESK